MRTPAPAARGGRDDPMPWRPKWYRDAILRQAPPDGIAAEVGVYRGDFSERILKVTRPRKLYLVDPWKFFASNPSKLWGANSGIDQAAMDAIHDHVAGRFRREVTAGTVVLCRATSVEFAATIPDGHLNWVYIDADHRYPAALDDIRAFWPKLVPGGVMIGDDYDLPNSFFEDGVTKSVAEFSAQVHVPVEEPGRHQFILRKPAAP